MGEWRFLDGCLSEVTLRMGIQPTNTAHGETQRSHTKEHQLPPPRVKSGPIAVAESIEAEALLAAFERAAARPS